MGTLISWTGLDYTYTQRPPGEVYGLAPVSRRTCFPATISIAMCFLAFQEDALGIRDRHIIGVRQSSSGGLIILILNLPSRGAGRFIEEILTECTEEEKAKIVGGNASRDLSISIRWRGIPRHCTVLGCAMTAVLR